SSINFSLINNLISAVGADDIDLILEYLKRYDSSMEDFIDIVEDLVKKAMSYYRDFILPNKKYRTPNNAEKRILKQLRDELAGYEGNDEDELQSIPFSVARMFNETPKNLFKMFYEILFGQERGPRFGTFVQLVGKEKALNLLDTASGS
ncbi:MAG: hypothetical protein JRJ41_07445, partial [Deltaproteobacteria bacterium]|nr:hypothetical protein [Deltaproteobacteria bacterium]